MGHQLVQAGHSVLFTPTYRLIDELLRAKRDLLLEQELRRLDTYEVLILDDIGYAQQSRNETEVLFTLLAERYERRSVVTTTAPFMLKLMEDPNDWLSDLLPAIWSSMGPGVAPLLWAILDQHLYGEPKRAQAAFGLGKLAQTVAPQRDSVINGLLQRIESLRGDTPSLNAYIIHTLHRIEAPQAYKTIRNLFKKGWVDEKIVSASDFREDN